MRASGTCGESGNQRGGFVLKGIVARYQELQDLCVDVKVVSVCSASFEETDSHVFILRTNKDSRIDIIHGYEFLSR